MLKHCKTARTQFSKQETILEVLEVDWRKRNEIEFMVGELVGAAVNWSRCSWYGYIGSVSRECGSQVGMHIR